MVQRLDGETRTACCADRRLRDKASGYIDPGHCQLDSAQDYVARYGEKASRRLCVSVWAPRAREKTFKIGISLILGASQRQGERCVGWSGYSALHRQHLVRARMEGANLAADRVNFHRISVI